MKNIKEQIQSKIYWKVRYVIWSEIESVDCDLCSKVINIIKNRVMKIISSDMYWKVKSNIRSVR
jgi:hypothetical protein